MPFRAVGPSRSRSAFRRAALLAGVSAIALTLMSGTAPALDLRQLGSSSAAVAAASAAAQAGSAQAAAVAQQSQKTLAAAMQAIQAMQQVQANARAAGIIGPNSLGSGLPSVANGLSVGGLVPDSGLGANGANPVTSWINANTPTQTSNGTTTTVTIEQTAPYALLNWTTFNVGKNTIVDFIQGASSWVALNHISDPNALPSQILGQINAPGSVYVINQNGIIFGGSSQINVGTLIASSLNLNDSYASNPAKSNFLLGNGVLSSGTSPSFQSIDNNGNAYSAGNVTVNAGAQINAPGGDVLLLAPSVENDGAINTPSGQTLLLGGSDVLLNTGNSYLRGFVVTPNPNLPDYNIAGPPAFGGTNNNLGTTQWYGYYASTTPGSVVNNGSISAPQGNITIVAGTVNQNGVLTSTTSTTENGSINILAQGVNLTTASSNPTLTGTGNLTLGGVNDNPLYALYSVTAQPSLIQIIPEPTDQSQVTDTQAIANSSITLTGVNVDIRGIVQLQGYDLTNTNDQPGGISIQATGYSVPTPNTTGGITYVPTIGQVFLESGSVLDGSGTTDATASASRNSVAVELRVNELADSPVIEVGPLYQQTIYVDASASGTYADGQTWQGTPLADAGPSIALTTRSLDERMMNGAPITIGGAIINYQGVTQLPANLVQASGSTINISGGYITYTPGFVGVSTLITSTGQLVSATNAQPDVDYAGICCSFTVTHPAWGANVTQVYTSPLMNSGYYSPGYIQGGAGGSLTLNVAASVLNGSLYSTVVTGEKQLTATSAPTAASLNVAGTNVDTWLALTWGTAYSADDINLLSDANVAADAQQWVSGFNLSAGTETTLNSLLPTNAVGSTNSVYLPVSWLNAGVGTITLGANNSITLSSGNPVALPTFGNFSASANNVDVASAITAPSGTIALTGAFTTVTTSNTNFTNLTGKNINGTTSATSGQVTIEAGVTLSAAGAWTNDANGGAAASVAPNGGTISIGSIGNIEIGQGSVLDVSGGGSESSAGKITAGNGGTLSLNAGQAFVASPYLPTDPPPALPPQAALGIVQFDGGLQVGQLQGYGTIGSAAIGSGGTLNLTSVAMLNNGVINPVVATIQSASNMNGALLLQGAATKETGVDGDTFVPLSVSTDFFSSGGFANISLTAAGISNVTVTPAGPTQVAIFAPTVASLAVTNRSAPSAASLAGLATPVTLPSGIRPASSTRLHAVGELWKSEIYGTTPTGTVATSVDTTFGLTIAGANPSVPVIQTDPNGAVTLIGDQVAIVSGTVSAPGGSITFSGGTYNNTANATGGGPTPLNGEGVWLTGSGQLLAKGTQIAVPQSNGTTYQDVVAGGEVTVSGGDIILMPGSTIDVSGASGLSTLSAAGSGFSTGLSLASLGQSSFPVTSAGGTISISAILGGVLEGNLSGNSGGGDAAGGTLNVAIAAHGGNSNPGIAGYWPAIENTYITLQQSLQPGDPNYISAALLAPPGSPNSPTYSGASPVNDANIYVSADMINAGGFASLSLSAPGATGFVTFSGSTTLTLPNQLVINTATILVPTATGATQPFTETLSANYVQWTSSGIGVFGLPGAGTGTLTINANDIDLVGNVAVQGAQTTTFNVAGDLRLNATLLGSSYSGSLVSAQDLVFNAGQIYPSTDTTFMLSSATSITFEANGAPPQAPLSVGGVLNVYAPVINQGGTVRAPTGTINLGYQGQTDIGTSPSNTTFQDATPGALANNIGDLTSVGVLSFQVTGPTIFLPGETVSISNGGVVVTGIVTSGTTAGTLDIDATSLTQGGIAKTVVSAASVPAGNWAISTVGLNSSAGGSNLTLQAGSLTSVSAGGQTVLYGYVQNGTTWYYTPSTNTADGVAQSQPPAKVISLTGTSVSVAPGATIDESGGGDLFAGEFVPGTGGSLNIFGGPNTLTVAGSSLTIFGGANKSFPLNTNLYAVLPGYNGVTPYDPSLTTSGPALGQQVYLNGVPGLAAGVYTLLPSQYAQLPGAFLVHVEAAPSASTIASTRSTVPTFTLPDGSALTSGYFVTPGTGTTSEHWSVFQVMSSTVAGRYSEVTPNYANMFFPTQAAANGTAVPRLPQDAGQLAIAATGSLSFQGTGVFMPGANGLGGVADISGSEILVVDASVKNGSGFNVANYQPGSAQVGGDSDPDTWNPLVLSAADLDNLGVESLLLGGTRSFQSDGTHITANASVVVIANSNDNPLSLPDVQLIAKPDLVNNTISAADSSNQLTLVSTLAGTGQVIIAPGAVITASGPVPAGGASTYILSAPQSSPTVSNGSYSASDVQNYYLSAAAAQVGYVRVSGGGLVTISGGNGTYSGLATAVSTSGTATSWPGSNGSVTLTTNGGVTYSVGQIVQITGSKSQTLIGSVTAVTGNQLTVSVTSSSGTGTSTSETIANVTATSGGNYVLPNYAVPGPTYNGSVAVGAGALLSANNAGASFGSVTLFGTSATTLQSGAVIAAQGAELKSSVISLGSTSTANGLVLDQAALDSLSQVNALTLVSASTINLYGGVTLGTLNPLDQLTFDSGGLVAESAGASTFTAEQVTFQNTLGGAIPIISPPMNASLQVNAIEATAAGTNGAILSLGTGAVALAGFGGGVDLKSSGQIIATQNGSLSVQSSLILDAPRITAGSVTAAQAFTNQTPTFNTVAYTITAADNPTAPNTYYSVALQNSSGSPTLPAALLGNSLTINAGDTTISTAVVLPGGAFNLTANGNPASNGNAATFGNITINPGGVIDVSGQAIQFADVLASIGGGNINLTSPSGAISIASGAVLNVGDLAGILTLGQSSAGTLSLSAHIGGVIVDGTLLGQGPSIDTSGSFVLDTSTLAPTSAQTYDALAASLVAGGFGKSWNIRARTGDIDMTGLTEARSVTVSADTGNVVVSGTVNASAVVGVVVSAGSVGNTPAPFPLAVGQTITFRDPNDPSGNYIIAIVTAYNPTSGDFSWVPISAGGAGVTLIAQNQGPLGWGIIDSGTPTAGGQINIYAGNNLTIASTAVLDAHGDVANASGTGGQVWLGAAQAWNGTGTTTSGITLNVGAQIDVGANAPAAGDSGPVLGGIVTFSTARTGASATTSGSGVNLNVVGGSFANFVANIKGESAWDGLVIVGNKTYNTNYSSANATGSSVNATTGAITDVSVATGVDTFATQPGLNILAGQGITVSVGPGESMSGAVLSYNSTTGALVVDVTSTTGSGSASSWTLAINTTLVLTPALFQDTYLADASAFMSNQSGIWSSLGANTTNGTTAASSAGVINVGGTSILVNIRPGIAIKNQGDITVEGDSINPNGIDLSGSNYTGPGGSGTAGSVLNTGNSQSLDGHFGQYDEPIVLAIRAVGNLNFGICTGDCAAGSNGSPTLGSLSDGFWQYYTNASGVVTPLYGTVNAVTGAGATGAASLFAPAAAQAYNGLSGGLGADSATFFLTAGADTTAANPLAVNVQPAAGTLTVAGLPGGSSVLTANGSSAAADPLYIYNDDTNGYTSGSIIMSLANFVDYASLVRTGTGNINIATAQDLVLQSPLSLIYTAGTGYNVDGTSAQPLSGFTQYYGYLAISGTVKGSYTNADTLPASVFPTHGGDLMVSVGGNIVGAMSASSTITDGSEIIGQDQDLPYDMTALGSQLKLQSLCTASTCATGFFNLQGGFSALYATDAWLNNQTKTSSFYTVNNIAGTSGGTNLEATPGDYQLAWYTWFPFLENTIGSFGGGNISVKAGGSISLIQFVSPTNARDAGTSLLASSYSAGVVNSDGSLGAGLYVQGGGNVSVTAGGDVSGVYTYVQNGATALKVGGSVQSICVSECASSGVSVTIPVVIETSTGNVSVQADGSINISDGTVKPSLGSSLNSLDNVIPLPSFSLIQNGSFLSDLLPADGVTATEDKTYTRELTVLTGILTSIPTGTATLQAVGDVTLGTGGGGEGLLPPQVNLISLQGNITNAGNFATYPSPNGSVNLLARGSVTLSAGFQVSDINADVLPTLATIVAQLTPAQNVVPVTNLSLEGNSTIAAVLTGDVPAQLIVDVPVIAASGLVPVAPQIELDRHAGLHAGQNDLTRIIALDGDVTQGGTPASNGTIVYSFATSYEDITEATEVYAGRDVVSLALLGQNNNASDITSIVAGRDVTYPTQTNVPGVGFSMSFAIEIGGPGNVVVEAGRNVNLGNSAGIQTFGNLLNSSLPSNGGASITIQAGLGTSALDYSTFIAQFIDPASSLYAEPLQLFNPSSNGPTDALAYYSSLVSPSGSMSTSQELLINRIFFSLLRDSGREHTGATGETNYELGETIDTIAQFNGAYSNYQRAFAAIAAFIPTMSATGSFFGGLSTVRTQEGGNITILAPTGQVQVGLTSPPTGFPGYSNPTDPTYALDFGIVTERGGDIDIYAEGDISVNQSRIFTLGGGDMTIMSLDGSIDAGKGAKTVQAIQPPSVSFDTYGNITITPYGPASGSGIATLRALPGVPAGNVDLLAPGGFINFGDAGLRVSGNLSVATPIVLNASNVQVAGRVTGIPIVAPPDIGALTTAGNVAGSASKATEAPNDCHDNSNCKNDHPSVIIVEVLGYGGSDACDNPTPSGGCKGNGAPPSELRKKDDHQSYDPASSVQYVGVGLLSDDQKSKLTPEELSNLAVR